MNNEVNPVAQISLYPNPVRDHVKVEYNATASGIVTINILNIIGKNVLSIKNSVDPGMNIFSLNTSELPEGIYLFEIENNGELLRSKFMVSK